MRLKSKSKCNHVYKITWFVKNNNRIYLYMQCKNCNEYKDIIIEDIKND